MNSRTLAALGLTVASLAPLESCASTDMKLSDAQIPAVSSPEDPFANISLSTNVPLQASEPQRHPDVSFDASFGFENRYMASGFVIGDGPVTQGSLGATLNSGPLSGLRLFSWFDAQLTNNNAQDQSGVDEVDIGLSMPLGGLAIGDGRIDFNVGAQRWFLRESPDVNVFGASATYSDPTGLSVSLRGNHLNGEGGIPTGDFLALSGNQAFPLSADGGLSSYIGAEYGRAFEFFGASHQYITPRVGVDYKLSNSTSLDFHAGYQFGEGDTAPDQAIFGFVLKITL